jgi:hypothetical protein
MQPAIGTLYSTQADPLNWKHRKYDKLFQYISQCTKTLYQKVRNKLRKCTLPNEGHRQYIHDLKSYSITLKAATIKKFNTVTTFCGFLHSESLNYDLLCGITGTTDLSTVKNITLRIR